MTDAAARDWLRIASVPGGECGRILTVTPHSIAVTVAHHQIAYGKIIEDAHGGFVLKCIKRAVFQAVRDTIVMHSIAREDQR